MGFLYPRSFLFFLTKLSTLSTLFTFFVKSSIYKGFGKLTISFLKTLCYTVSTAWDSPRNFKKGSVTDGTFDDLQG